MIGDEDHPRVLAQPSPLETVEDPPEVGVHEAHLAVVLCVEMDPARRVEDRGVALVLVGEAMRTQEIAVALVVMKDESTQAKAKQYGVTRVPAVAVNGTLADCCASGAIDGDTLRALGVGSAA